MSKKPKNLIAYKSSAELLGEGHPYCSLLDSEAALPDFGIGYMSVNDASMLITKCLAFEGAIKVDYPDDVKASIFDESTDEYFRDDANRFLQRLIDAIEKKILIPEVMGRNIDNQICSIRTIVGFGEVVSWLGECGLSCGDFFADYRWFLVDLHEAAGEAVAAARLKKMTANPEEKTKEEIEQELLITKQKYFEKIVQVERLHARIREVDAKPISLRAIDSYLNIIGALVGLLLDQGANEKSIGSQQSIIDAIHLRFGSEGGLSKRNLEDKFADGKRSLGARS